MNRCPKCGFQNPRNLDQNALSHVWFLQIADFMHVTPIEAKAYCKLNYGVPILRAESETFREWYDKLIKGRYSYEEKLELMQHIRVTSLMTKGQFARFMSDVQHHFADNGLVLISINDEEAA